jgi:dTMP kinase
VERAERKGVLIAFEGTEGAGKSSHVRYAAQVLAREGHDVRVTAEPGGTPLGVKVRELVLHDREAAPTAMAELFLYLADRAQHVAQVVRPALAAGAVVLTDRYSASTIAYQSYGRGLDLEMVSRVDSWARSGLAAHMTVLLDCPVRVGLQRARGGDRFHAETDAFHERVRAGFLTLAAADAKAWCIIDASQPEDVVREQVMEAVRTVVEWR